MPDPMFPTAVLEEASSWARFFGEEWAREFPNAVPPNWPTDFAHLLADAPDVTTRQRANRVMRKLHRASPRAYEVLLRTMIYGETLARTTDWLNERAVRNDIPLEPGQKSHYSFKDTVALFLVGCDFVRSYW